MKHYSPPWLDLTQRNNRELITIQVPHIEAIAPIFGTSGSKLIETGTKILLSSGMAIEVEEAYHDIIGWVK